MPCGVPCRRRYQRRLADPPRWRLSTADPSPDLLPRRAVLAGSPGRPRDVLLRVGRVAAVADDLAGGTPGLAAPSGADVVDLGGTVVLPGPVDAHVRMEQEAAVRRRHDASSARSAREAADLAAAAAGGQDASAAVVAHGFRGALWPDAPHRHLLDERLPGRAVVLVSADLHTARCSTAALHRLGVDSPHRGRARGRGDGRVRARGPV